MPSFSGPNQLVKLLSNMSKKDLNTFGVILSQGEIALESGFGSFNYFFSNNPRLSDLKQFLIDNEITYLGGNNSKNFQIQPQDGSAPYVLKLEKWAAEPALESRIQNNTVLKKILAVVHGQQQAVVNNQTVRIQVTGLYSGDIETISKKITPDETRLNQALDIYQQMGEAYEAYRKAGIVFPDGKNSNWLINDQNKLVMADTKSLLDAPRSQLNTGLEHYKKYFMSIPEGPPYHTDKVHSLHLGKKLYQYLSKCEWRYLADPLNPESKHPNYQNGCDANNYNFNAPIFQTPMGLKFQELIKKVVQINPENRLSVADALLEMKKLQTPENDTVLLHKAPAHTQFKAPIINEEVNKSILKNKITETIIHENDPFKVHEINSSLTKLLNNCPSDYCDRIKITQRNINLYSNIKSTKLHNLVIETKEFKNKYDECQELIKKIKTFKIGEKDMIMENFLRQQQTIMDKQTDVKGISNIADKLHNTLSIVISGKQEIDLIQTLHRTYQNDTCWYKFGKKEKGNKIEAALLNVPIEQRNKILNTKNPETMAVQVALATRRGFIINPSPLDKKGNIIESKCAPRFIELKNKLKALQKANIAPNSDSDTLTPTVRK